MKKLTNRLSQNKYKLLMILLLALASALAVAMDQAHLFRDRKTDFPSLIRDLSLAWVPLVLALLAYAASWSRKLIYWLVPLLAFAWLIFFPNAPYMLTEFLHLRLRVLAAPPWFDALTLLWFAWIGLLLGVFSLSLMHEIVARKFHSLIGWLFVLVAATVDSLGVYLGRFLRWNSWDIFLHPIHMARDIKNWFRISASSRQSYGFVILFTLLFLFVYLAFHAFSRSVQESWTGRPGKP